MSTPEYRRDGALRPPAQREGASRRRYPCLPRGLLQPDGQHDRKADKNKEYLFHPLVYHELAAKEEATAREDRASCEKDTESDLPLRRKVMPEISIIVPVYNAEKYLRECVKAQ